MASHPGRKRSQKGRKSPASTAIPAFGGEESSHNPLPPEYQPRIELLRDLVWPNEHDPARPTHDLQVVGWAMLAALLHVGEVAGWLEDLHRYCRAEGIHDPNDREMVLRGWCAGKGFAV